MRRGRYVVAAAAAIVCTTLPAGSAGEAVAVQTGTWFVGELTGLPAPPTVPMGGLWISGTPLGPYAFSAVRFTLPADRGDPTLSLRVARLTTTPSTPLGTGQNPIVACVTTSAWKPTGTTPGSWSAAPTYDCTKGEISGVLTTDGSTLTFELASIARPGQTISLALAPGTISNPIPATVPVPVPMLPTLPALPLGLSIPNPTAGQINATFDATFQALTAGSLTTAAVAVTVTPPRAAVTPFASPTPIFTSPPAPLDQPTFVAAPSSPAVLGRSGPAVAQPAPLPTLAVATPAHQTHDDAGHRVVAALLLGLFVGWAAHSLGRRRGYALTLYDIPAAGVERPTTTLTRVKRA